MNHKALITTISVRKHPNADRLQLGTVLGYQVIVGMNVKEGDLGILFPEGLQLSEEFAKANNLLRVKNEDGSYSGGFFEQNRRVRAQKFRGEVSDAFWIPIHSLTFAGDYSELRVGDFLDEFKGVKICQKYYSRAIRRADTSQKKSNKVKKVFPEHFETAQLRLNLHKLKVGSTVYITEKVHGTSARTGLVPVERDLTWAEKLIEWFGFKVQKTEYKYITGSRRLVFEKAPGFRAEAAKRFEGKLHKNEIVYYEIVGFEGEAHIMPPHSVEKMKDKAVQKQYGRVMEYVYGCPRGSFDIYVYRIALINEDGMSYDLPWSQVKLRCEEMGMKYVPEFDSHVLTHPPALQELVESLSDGPSTIDERHIREGVCVRVDGRIPTVLKSKGFTFKVLEGIIAEQEDYVDPEDAA